MYLTEYLEDNKMGIFSKVWKGIKKVAKKIGKGIKKAVYKVAEVFGKLGIVGQLALGFLMPYALGALSSMFGAVGTKVATWAGTLANSSNFVVQKIGQGMQAVINIGTSVKEMYGTVTKAITNGIDKTKEFFGFKPTDTVNIGDEVTKRIDASTTPSSSFMEGLGDKGGNISASTSTSTTSSSSFMGGLGDKGGNISSDLLGAETTDTVTEKIIADASTGVTTNVFQDIASGTKEFFSNINVTNADSKIRQDIADFSAYDYAKSTAAGAVEQAVVGGAVAAGQQKIASALGYKVPNSNQTYINLPEMQAAGRNVGKYNEATLWAQENGNNFVMQSFRPRDYVAEAFGNEDSVALYFAKMQNQFYNQDQNNTLFTGTA